MLNKRGQVTIFVIIALIIIGGVIGYFAVKGNLVFSNDPGELKPVFDYYDECIKQGITRGVSIAESQAGWIETPDFIPGTYYAPSSSQLSFLGLPVPYWHYISGNGLVKKQIPTKTEIENQMARYLEEEIQKCNFEQFHNKGFKIDLGTPSAKVKIADTKVSVNLNSDVTISKDQQSASKTDHNVEVNTKFGKLYNTATGIYNKEMSDAFLEQYASDVLRLYAPVDGVELTCAPKIWKTKTVFEDIRQALQANIAAIKFKGNYYQLSKEQDKYFVVNKDVDEAVNLLYFTDWPTKIVITGADNELMVAEPVGNQEGLGIMGFCYAPYHFVYDLHFPVLIQVYDGTEVFQFPVVVVIDKNMPRNAMPAVETSEQEEFDLCAIKAQELEVDVLDIHLTGINANVSFKCFDQVCRLGEAKNGKLETKAPACINGLLQISAGGYADKNILLSSNQESKVDVILDREYEVEVELRVDGKQANENALISFSGQRSAAVALPDVKSTTLSEGAYNVSVFVYKNSSISLPQTTKEQCFDTAKSGVLGLLGATEKKCVDISIPETKIESALIGGGRGETYFLPDLLEKGKIIINVDGFPEPKSLDELQNNYAAFEGSKVGVEFP